MLPIKIKFFTIKTVGMKPFVLVIAFVAAFFTSNAQTFTVAVEYNDFIVDQQNKIGQKILLLVEKFGEEGMTKEGISPTLEDLLATAKSGVAATKQLGPFEGGAQLKESALALFQFYVRIIDIDYREMINILYVSALDDAAMTRLNEIIAKVQAEEAKYDGNFQAAQSAFATANNITLEENELQDEIDRD